ncbi:unnamed protein product [Caenorhabditis sp. 36 PRJEB53466]|nr:unnamed protein product [Caenorhabditis sp. 36 PRJEB53466]
MLSEYFLKALFHEMKQAAKVQSVPTDGSPPDVFQNIATWETVKGRNPKKVLLSDEEMDALIVSAEGEPIREELATKLGRCLQLKVQWKHFEKHDASFKDMSVNIEKSEKELIGDVLEEVENEQLAIVGTVHDDHSGDPETD